MQPTPQNIPSVCDASAVGLGPRHGFVGTAPINWNNDDVEGWAPYVPFPDILDEMVAAGYTGTEYGAEFPTDAKELRAALDMRGLRLCGSYQWLHLLDDRELSIERETLEERLKLLASAGCEHLIVAVAMTPERIALAGHVPDDGSAGLSDAEWDKLVCNLTKVARQAADWNIKTHYHNHVGTFVETPAEVERLLAGLDAAAIDLCFDTGHYAYGGGDPTAFVSRHYDHIGYLHLKDVDPEVVNRARERGWSFLDALRQCIFCEFGEGIVDIPRMITTLVRTGYEGWVIVEQDTSRRPATESARASRGYLRERCGL